MRSFKAFPPEPVVINAVAPETWGVGRFQGGEEVVAVNGQDVAAMSREEFREALQVRPLKIRFQRANKAGMAWNATEIYVANIMTI